MQTSFFLLSLWPALTAAEMTCYYPDASVATGHIPCNATASDTQADASACCSGYPNDYCLANGLCWFDGILSRGSCTDRNWASPSCTQWCIEEQRNTSMNIFPCHEQGVWQCEWHADCTSNFTLLTSEIAVIIRDDQQPNAQNAIGFADVNAKFTAIDQTTSSSTAATPELPSTPFAGSSNPTSTPNTIATTASSLPDDPSSTSALARAASSTLSAGAKAGIAVGTVVGALAAGTLLCALFVHWRRTVRANGPENTSHLCGHCGCAKPELTGQPTRTEIDATEVKPEVTAQNLPWEMGDGREINRSGF